VKCTMCSGTGELTCAEFREQAGEGGECPGESCEICYGHDIPCPDCDGTGEV